MSKFFKIAHGMDVGSMVEDINKSCPHHGARGKVVKAYPNQVTFIVVNKGKNFRPGDKLTKTISQMEKVAIAKTDPVKRPPRINNIGLSTRPVTSTVGQVPWQFGTFVPDAKYNNMAKKPPVENNKVAQINEDFLKSEDFQKALAEYKEYKRKGEHIQHPKLKLTSSGRPVDTIDTPLSSETLQNVRSKGQSEVVSTQALPVELLWNEYKGSLTRDQFDKMIKQKQTNISNQKAIDKNLDPVLEFGLGGKRMVKSDSYPDLSDKNLNKKINLKFFPDDVYDSRVGKRSVGVWNPASRTIKVRSQHAKKDQKAGYASDVTSHELRHVLHPFTGKFKENKNLYTDYPRPIRDRHVHDAYVDSPDAHQTDHHLVDLGLLHSLYVKHGNKPIIHKEDTDNFMNWYKQFKQENKGRYGKDGHLFKLDPDSDLDKKFLRRNMPLVVDKKPKEQKKLASLGFNKQAGGPLSWVGKKVIKPAVEKATNHPIKAGAGGASWLFSPGYELKSYLEIPNEPNLFDEFMLGGFPLTDMMLDRPKRKQTAEEKEISARQRGERNTGTYDWDSTGRRKLMK